ncbi:MAG: PIN domain-containing protein [Planctomycetes bacterium]|nr:PIN domain-containing protein [Planctomycetota bacterium]
MSSEALEAENAMNPQPERRSRASELLARFGRTFRVTPSVEDRAERLERSGFGSFDALHLACAKAAGVEVLLTCDEALRRRARASGKRLLVSVENPVDFLRRRP